MFGRLLCLDSRNILEHIFNMIWITFVVLLKYCVYIVFWFAHFSKIKQVLIIQQFWPVSRQKNWATLITLVVRCFYLVFFFLFFFSLSLPGMCVKTFSEPAKEKVFINICRSNLVPPPPELSKDELVQLLQSEDPSGYRVPMSLGEPHTEVDNSMYWKLAFKALF